MKTRNKILLAIATIMLLGVFVFPLWEIRLKAPQYPEGLGMNIWVNTIKAQHPHNIETINDLNHYIGMKAIEPDSVPELRIMPYAIALLFVLGAIVVFVSNRIFLTVWLVIFAGLAITGLVDFYLWLYDYGHDLSPSAAIKVPGMSYQPPVFGSKQLLNIHVTSYPDIGGILVVLALLIGIYVLINELRSPKSMKTES